MSLEWNKVTWYSKLVAIIVFLATFAVAFFIGFQYGQIGTFEDIVAPVVDLPKPIAPVSVDFVAGVGENKTVGDVTVTVHSVSSDSRCPVDVVCIWAGVANINVTLSNDTVSETRVILSDGAPSTFVGYKVSVTGLLPEANSKKEILQNEYKVSFHIENNK